MQDDEHDGKTAIVTGANSGIGLETARGLARKGYRTVLLCRNAERAEAARADIAASVPGAQLEVVLVDLGSQPAVRQAATEVTERVDRLDLLVNNAGLTIRRKEVLDGIDAMLAVNQLGPFLLTGLLSSLLTATGSATAPARIVNLASDAHKFAKVKADDPLGERTTAYGPLGLPRYGQTKMLNILWTRALARRVAGTGVVANCVHPGAVRTNLGAPPAIIAKVVGLFLLAPEQGAATSLAAATDPAYAHTNGSYFVKSRPADGKLNTQARDDSLGERVWDRCAELTGLATPG